ncbi:hypothetical protein GCM10007377_16320 [Galliscardovia ingluviei]|uniref:Uncharacterized protein n=1 Tax=Galliscardovia ingluviei TaxID=1769422 RepID=A0A8J3AKU6_9BIFI|nr:hypothetical protein GCM10007377_16320 [Galliscardovia ingluviei]
MARPIARILPASNFAFHELAFQKGSIDLDEAARIIEPLVGDKAEQAILAYERHLKEM